MIIVPTIRNTGSHFVLNMLGAEQPWRPDVLAWRGAVRATEDSIIFDHVFPHQRHIFLPLIEDNLTIVPLRHPLLTAKSWTDRGHELGDLIAMWEVMAYDIDSLDPYYLPLDVPDREDYLTELRDMTGLDTDWAPHGSQHNNYALRYTELSLIPAITALCERIEPFLAKFY